MGVSRAPPVHHRARPAARRAAGVLPCADDRRGPAPSSRRTPPRPATSPAACSAGWAPTAGSASAGRSSTAGRARSALDQFIFFDEVQRAGRAVPVRDRQHGRARRSCATAPTSRSSASCPGSSRGEIKFAIGYTEPEAGTDLAVAAHSRRPRRRRVGDQRQQGLHERREPGRLHLARLPHRPRRAEAQGHLDHRSCPTTSPGFKRTPIVTVGGVVTTATYYDDVRVPEDNVVGEVNGGWRLITNQLNHERVGLAALGGRDRPALRRRRRVVPRHARGRHGSTCRGCSSDLAAAHARLEAMKLLNWRMAAAIATGDARRRPTRRR